MHPVLVVKCRSLCCVTWLLSSGAARAQLPLSMWDLSSLTREQIRIHCIGRWILNHLTREVPNLRFYVSHLGQDAAF